MPSFPQTLSLLGLVSLVGAAAAPSPAAAQRKDGGRSTVRTERRDAPKVGTEPFVAGAGSDASGQHLILVLGGQGPKVFLAKKGQAPVPVKVLDIDRVKDAFVVDTMGLGELSFSTRESRVVKAGSIGFRPESKGFVMDAEVDLELIGATFAVATGAPPAAPAKEATTAPVQGLKNAKRQGKRQDARRDGKRAMSKKKVQARRPTKGRSGR
jgi:hypothetical protein